MLMLLIAAMGKQKKELCMGFDIVIKGERKADFFLDESGISKLLVSGSNRSIKGQSKSAFNLRQLEQLLEDNVWIKDAQLYFDNKSVLHVVVEEREPVARVITESGYSFYIDKEEAVMPVSDKAVTKLPVFTGYPEKKPKPKRDSILLHEINEVASYINEDSFWLSQVAQVDIVTDCGKNCWEFEMTPVVGRHVIKLGNGENVADKFRRLFAFYQQVLGRTGWDRYKTIDVRYVGQVVGGKSENPKVDSLVFVKRANELLRQAKEVYEQELKETVVVEKSGAVPVRSAIRREGKSDEGKDKPEENRVPKAVMPKRNNDANNLKQPI
jgi:cell division protein FtsQ